MDAVILLTPPVLPPPKPARTKVPGGTSTFSRSSESAVGARELVIHNLWWFLRSLTLFLDYNIMIGRKVGPTFGVLRLDTCMPQSRSQFHLMCDLPDATVLVVTLCLYHRDGAPGIGLYESRVRKHS